MQAFLQPKTPYEWLIAGVGAAVGGWLASEITWTQWFTGLTDLGPQFDGLLIIPAVLGGILIGALYTPSKSDAERTVLWVLLNWVR